MCSLARHKEQSRGSQCVISRTTVDSLAAQIGFSRDPHWIASRATVSSLEGYSRLADRICTDQLEKAMVTFDQMMYKLNKIRLILEIWICDCS